MSSQLQMKFRLLENSKDHTAKKTDSFVTYISHLDSGWNSQEIDQN